MSIPPVDFLSHKGPDFSLQMIMKLSQSTCTSPIVCPGAHLRQGNFAGSNYHCNVFRKVGGIFRCLGEPLTACFDF